jgi:hypothetical protein
MEDNTYPGMGDGADESSGAPSPDEGQEGQEASDKDEMGGETALIPKSLLAGKEFNPGDEVVLKIVHDHGDEIEVQYATEKPGEGDAGAGKPEMDNADAKLGAMAY